MPHTNGAYYEFGPYRLDAGRRVLMRGDEAVALAPKVTEILILLVRRAGELIEKEDLIEQIWPDSFVEEANVSQNIFYLRRALGDVRGEPRFIETVVKRGYRFIAPVQMVQCEPESDDSETLRSTPPKLAVLPLVNTTQDPSVEYLVDGLTDNIINNLSSVSKLRVMSRGAVGRYKKREVDPQKVGRDLGVDVVLLGKINSRPAGLMISVELVDVSNGWQLWGESFDCAQHDMLEIQNQILMQLSVTLQLKLTGEEEKRITARYTESGEAYQAYLEGRFHWSHYTRKGIEKAIGCFRQAIEMDPNYALAYAGIVDCYLRLATNYLPPEEDSVDKTMSDDLSADSISTIDVGSPRVKLRHEWDWRGAEREIRRASDLQMEYPSAHQWYVAYLFARQLFEASGSDVKEADLSNPLGYINRTSINRPSQIASLDLTKTEQVQVFCTIARDQLEIGNYEAATLILRTLRLDHGWPNLSGLTAQSAGDLLFTLGVLIGNLAASGRLLKGHRHAEALLNGAVAIFEHLSLKDRSGEARIELGRCFYREGLFELSSETVTAALHILEKSDPELRSRCLVVYGAIDRETGRLSDSIQKLEEASKLCTPRSLTAFRCYFELGTTFKELSLVEGNLQYAESSSEFFYKALQECDAVGNHLYEANVRNNLGLLFVNLGQFEEAEIHLLRSHRLFAILGDKVRAAIVQETLAQLYVAMEDYDRAWTSIDSAVRVLECNDSEAMFADALITKGLVAARTNQIPEAYKLLAVARRVVERCGIDVALARILLIQYEDLYQHLQEGERKELLRDLNILATKNNDASTFRRIRELIERIAENDPEGS